MNIIIDPELIKIARLIQAAGLECGDFNVRPPLSNRKSILTWFRNINYNCIIFNEGKKDIWGFSPETFTWFIIDNQRTDDDDGHMSDDDRAFKKLMVRNAYKIV